MKEQKRPKFDKIRSILFWDTDINNIDWQKQKKAVIRRIFERGNEEEIEEIISFYSISTVIEELNTIPRYLPSLAENADKYLGIKLISTDGEK